MTKLHELETKIASVKTRSAWSKGVQTYALELINDAINNYDGAFKATHDNIEAILLNGALNWRQYSDGGCSLIYDECIAARLCTASEYKRCHYKDGTLKERPNKTETWLECQERALYQAYRLIDSYIF